MQKMEYHIRPAQREDVPAILHLVKKLAEYEKLADQMAATETLFEQNGFGGNQYFRALLAESRETEMVRPLGFALYFFTFSTFLGKPTLYLEDLFVLPEFRGKGIGKSLLVELGKIARAKKCGRMEWSVLDWNKPAIEFYLRLGAISMDEWTVYRLDEQGIENLVKG